MLTTANTTFANIPIHKTCEFCGQELETVSVTVCGKQISGLPCFGSCGCERSKLKLAELEGRVPKGTDLKIQRYLKAGIGQAYLEAKSDPELYQHVKGGGSLFITGAIGTGKTYLASGIAARMIDAGKRVRFETTVGVLRELRESFGSAPSRILERCIDCDILVFDDFGKEPATEFALATIFEVINIRYANNFPMIVTSNYQGGELVAHMAKANTETAKAIMSRLVGMCKLVTLDGGDRRIA